MEPLVRTVTCPNCHEAIIAFLEGHVGACPSCGFDAEVFDDRESAFARFRRFSSEGDVIVAEPERVGERRWIVAHARLLLV